MAGGRWALRKDLEARGELSRIAEGAGLADTIADRRETGQAGASQPQPKAI